jgi:hypothetical protein
MGKKLRLYQQYPPHFIHDAEHNVFRNVYTAQALTVLPQDAKAINDSHKESCIAHWLTTLRLQEAYDSKWQHHCRKCHGLGGFLYSYDPSPAGVSLSPGYMQDFDTCSDCVEQGKCPRCGKLIYPLDQVDKFNEWLDNQTECPHCKWHHGQDASDTRPLEYDGCCCDELLWAKHGDDPYMP